MNLYDFWVRDSEDEEYKWRLIDLTIPPQIGYKVGVGEGIYVVRTVCILTDKADQINHNQRGRVQVFCDLVKDEPARHCSN